MPPDDNVFDCIVVNRSVHTENPGSSTNEMSPESKVHGANMWPTWVLSAPDEPHVDPMNLLSGAHRSTGPMTFASANNWSATDLENSKDPTVMYLLSNNISKLTTRLEMSDSTICYVVGHVIFGLLDNSPRNHKTIILDDPQKLSMKFYLTGIT